MNFVIVTLADGKKAAQIDGLPDSPVYVRVRRTRKEVVRAGNSASYVVIAAEPYEVNADGQELAVGPGRTISLDASAIATGGIVPQDEVQALKEALVQEYIAFRQGVAQLNQMADELI